MAKLKKLPNLDYFAISDKGRVRESNEDQFICINTLNGTLLIVCDGVGGNNGGETAAEIAINSLREYFENKLYDDLAIAITDALAFANNQIIDEANNNPLLSGMATTCVLVIIKNNLLYCGSIGDSRLYINAKNRLQLITTDHTFVQEEIDNGHLLPQDALTHPKRHQLTQALGFSTEINPFLTTEPIKLYTDDIVLLCSDGLNTMLTEHNIEYVLNENNSIQQKTNKLLQLAIHEGGYDNITIIAAQYCPAFIDNLDNTDNTNVINDDNLETKKINHNSNKNNMENKNTSAKFKEIIKRKEVKIAILAIVAIVFIFVIIDLFFSNKTSDENNINNSDSTLVEENMIINNDSSTVNETETDTLQDEIIIAGEFNEPEATTENPVSAPANNNVITKQPEKNNTNTSKTNNTTPTSGGSKIDYKIQKGDVLSTICIRFNVSKNKVMQLNNLKSDKIKLGETLKIPVKAIYKVKSGDNLYNIAKKYGSTREKIRIANKLKTDADIRAGQKIYIPVS